MLWQRRHFHCRHLPEAGIRIEAAPADDRIQYSFKEALLPVSDTIMYFTESSVKIPEEKRKRLVFLRACDLNALKRLDEIYLHNGPEDFYYKNIRENAKFILMGCSQSFKSCFCVSMGTPI